MIFDVLLEHNILIKQEYGQHYDWIEHIKYLLTFFKDPKYIKIDKKDTVLHKKMEIIKSLNPKVLFLQENVGSASKLDVGIMSRALGVYPVRINSSLVTAQLRDRYYWSNIKTKETMFDLVTNIPQPKDKGIMFKDIITSGYVEKIKTPTAYTVANMFKKLQLTKTIQKNIAYKKFQIDSKLQYFKPNSSVVEKSFAD